MLWVTWRQHRAELFAALLLLAGVAIPVIISGLAMHAEYQADGIAACVTNPHGRNDCGHIVDRFVTNHITWANRLVWVAFLPALAGVFIGAPLLAREFEQGTWRLAFTQSITRTRWLTAQLSIVAVGVAALSIAFALLFTWWRTPIAAIDGSMRSTGFMIAPVSLSSAAVFAFALGIFFGALLRRAVAAMGATFAVYLAVRVPMEEVVRPNYLTPLTRITDPVVSRATEPAWEPTKEWVVGNGWIDSTGHRLSDREEGAIIGQVYGGHSAITGSGSPMEHYLAEHGLRHYTDYHPHTTFWTMQLIEAGLFLSTAALLLTAAVWLVRRHTV